MNYPICMGYLHPDDTIPQPIFYGYDSSIEVPEAKICCFCTKKFISEDWLLHHLRRRHAGQVINRQEVVPPLHPTTHPVPYGPLNKNELSIYKAKGKRKQKVETKGQIVDHRGRMGYWLWCKNEFVCRGFPCLCNRVQIFIFWENKLAHDEEVKEKKRQRELGIVPAKVEKVKKRKYTKRMHKPKRAPSNRVVIKTEPCPWCDKMFETIQQRRFHQRTHGESYYANSDEEEMLDYDF